MNQKFFGLFLLFLLQLPRALAQPVVINEIMYHPPSTNLLEEWFELYNPATNAVDLSGWQITKGVAFTFPTNTVLGAGGYLVVAADGPTFASKHPGVPNYVGGWVGDLGHSLELSDNTGQVINSIQFFQDGDWGTLVLGAFTYNHQGWENYAAHDGLGSSLELVNPALPNTYAHNWGSSTAANGTPGQANSIAQTNAAPFIAEVAHSPIIPQPSDVVTVSARIIDEHTNGLTITLNYRVDGAASFSTVSMFDDGAHGDGLASDGIYAAILPAQPNGTIIEFYLQARDLEGNLRTYPSYVPPATGTRTANLLYQVDNGVYSGSQPIYRIIMREIERAELAYIGGASCGTRPDMDSDAAMNATWITVDGVVSGGSTTELRYNSSARNRGHGSRSAQPNNYHINIPSDRQWKKQAGIDLNSQYAHSQILGSSVNRRIGLAMADSRAVQVRVNSTNLMVTVGTDSFGSYAANEQYNNSFIKRSFPLDPAGNSYRGIRQEALCDPLYNTNKADFTWYGANFATAGYTNAYFKQNNSVQNDFSDLINLIAVLNVIPGYSSTATYVADVQRTINVEEWMKYMAAGELFDNQETALDNGIGDDYALYRGINDTRFLALPYDMDTLMGQGQGTFNTSDSLFRMTALPTMDRFMKTPEFAPIYYKQLYNLATTTFSPAQMNVFLDQLLSDFVPAATLTTMKNFNAARNSYVLSQIPLTLSVTSSLPVLNGYPHATTPTTTLVGLGNVIDTRTILVKGATSSWTAWRGSWTNNNVALVPGINRILVQALGTNGTEIDRTTINIWYDTGAVPAASQFGGTLGADKTLTLAGSPYQITNNLIIPSGRTLTVQPGVTVYLSAGVAITANDGGRILAEGTDTQNILFESVPGGAAWGGITINGSVGSVETRLAYIFIQGNNGVPGGEGNTSIEVAGGTLYLDHAVFGTTTHQYLSLDSSSFLISSCYFPTTSASFELVHGTGGIKAGGRGIVRECFFGTTTDYNDIMDFTGGNRDENQPIIQYYNNVLVGGSDDQLDLDGTDAWIEGNIFLHSHRNGTTPDSSSSISGGNYNFGGAEGVRTSEITVIGNLFFDDDNAADAKEGNFFTFLNNTIVHITKTGGIDYDSGVVCEQDIANNGTGAATAIGKGYYLEGNIIWDVPKLVRNYDSTNAPVVFNNNILSLPWPGPGTNNSLVDPRLTYIPQVSETYFTNWQQAQVMWKWFSLQPGSPAAGSGPNGRDKGGVIPYGASVSGEPGGTTRETNRTLTVGSLMIGSNIPTNGFPKGSGFTSYEWKLDNGAFSAEISITNPITLTGLANGPHNVSVLGKNDAGYYQNDAALGPDATVTVSKTWTVSTAYSRLVLNEILTKNNAILTNAGTTPDLVELYNDSPAVADLSGMGITDDAATPYKFSFPPGTTIPAGSYLVLYADSSTFLPGIHLGFSLTPSGGAVYLHASTNAGAALLDSVVFGIQLPDVSIGRLANGTWGLCQPTFGSANLAQPVGNPRTLKINEWLADAQFVAKNDFIELYNPDVSPVPLGGLYLSDAAGAPGLSLIPPLSFIAAKGYTSFTADAQPEQGADHVNFKLSPDVGIIILSAADLTTIDVINYGPQRTDISQGRVPDGGNTLSSFADPTSGGPNPSVSGGSNSVVLNEILARNESLPNSDGLLSDWVELFNPSASTLDLSGLSLTDDATLPRKWVFPTNVTMAAGAYRVIYLDPNVPASTNNSLVLYAGFALKGAGEALFLFNRPSNGGGLLDGLYFGLQTPDFSVGRVPNGVGSWALNVPTPGAMNVAAGVGSVATLKINEWMASAASGSDWFEIYNGGSQPVPLGGLFLTDNLSSKTQSPIPPLSFIGSGNNAFIQFFADGNPNLGASHVSFKMKKSGESIGIFTPAAVLVNGVNYGAQVTGVSQGRLPDGSANIVSFVTTPSPGERNYLPLTSVIINEALSHTAPPLEDAIELFNPTTASVDLSGWFLSNDKNDLFRFRIPNNTVIQPGGFAVLYESQFNPNPGFLPSFSLSGAHGEDLFLSAMDLLGNFLGYHTDQKFGGAEDVVSFGRYFTSEGIDFVAMSQRTFGVDNPATLQDFRTGTGLSNVYPKVGPVVINEIMYHPPPIGTNDDVADEFIELKNITGATVSLFDPAHPTNTWHLRHAVDFDFPTNASLPAGGYLLVVSFDPATNAAALASFRANYGLSPSVPIFGPYIGSLNNGGDTIELHKPDAPQPQGLPDAGFVPSILVEQVEYSNVTPWASAADGNTNGFLISLQRRSPTGYGNDVTNWLAGTATPGADNGPAVMALPSILSVTPPQTVSPGAGATLTVSAIGNAPLSFQWRFNGALITGATNSSLTLGSVQDANAGSYGVLVSNPGGAASGVTRVDLALPPVITEQPQSTAAAAGGTASFSVGVHGSTPLSFQWQRTDGLLGSGTNGTLILSNVQQSDATNYNVVVTNLYGSATSAVAFLSLSAAPAIVTQPQSTNVFVGAAVTFSVAAIGAQPLGYQWLYNTNAIINATNASLILNNVQVTNSGNYSVRVTNAVGTVFSSSAILTVTVFVASPPSITQQPQAQVADPGSNAVFSVGVAGTAPFRYQWRNAANQVMGTNSTLTFTNVQPANAGFYKVLIGNSAGTVTSQLAELIVRPKITQGIFTNGAFRLTLSVTTNKQYAIESAPNLPNWSVLTNVSPSDVQLQYNDTSAPPATNRFYRLRILP